MDIVIGSNEITPLIIVPDASIFYGCFVKII